MASKSINPFEITNVFICGAGQMGTWISQKISTQGFNTIIYDTNEKTLKTIQEKKIKNLSIENSISKASNADLIIGKSEIWGRPTGAEFATRDTRRNPNPTLNLS